MGKKSSPERINTKDIIIAAAQTGKYNKHFMALKRTFYYGHAAVINVLKMTPY